MDWNLGNNIKEHAHTIVLSFLLFTGIYKLSRPISGKLFPMYNSFKQITKINWDIHVVSSVHAIVISFLAIPLLFDTAIIQDKLFGYSYEAGKSYYI